MGLDPLCLADRAPQRLDRRRAKGSLNLPCLMANRVPKAVRLTGGLVLWSSSSTGIARSGSL